MTRSPRVVVSALVTCSLALLFTQTPAAQQKPPSRRELDQLVKQFLTIDGRTLAGHADQKKILERLATVPPLDKRKLIQWQKKIVKLWSKGRKLDKTGDNWFWPKGKDGAGAATGRYVVGGRTKKPKGLAITMHGGGLGSGDAGAAASAYRSHLSKVGWLMIAPEVLVRTEHGWTDSGSEEFVLDLVDAALRTWKIDPDHVYFVGHSMGGYGSWMLGAHHADRVGAIAPSAGAPTPIRSRKGGPVIDIQAGIVPSLRNIFVSVYQSTDDVQVPPAGNQFAVKLLAKAAKKWGGFAHDYWEVHDRGHAGPPGGYVAQLQKIVPHVRNPVPERIVWQPALAWKRQFYWLYWQQPVVGATVVADLDRAKNQVSITCEESTDGLYVLLDERVLDLAKDVVVVVNGEQVFGGKVEPELRTLLVTSQHPDAKLRFVARAPAFAEGG